ERKAAGEALVLELTTKENVASMPPEYKIDTVYIDRKTGFRVSQLREGLTRVGGPILGAVMTGTNHVLKKADEHFEKHVVPAVSKVSGKAYHFTRKTAGAAYGKIRGRKIHHHSDETTSAKVTLPPKAAKLYAPVAQFGQNAGQWLKTKLTFSQNGTTNKARTYGIWGVALLIVLIVLVIVGWRPGGSRQAVNTNTEQLTTDLGEKFNRVKLLSAYNDRASALKELATIISQIQSYEAENELPPSLTELKKQSIGELASLTNSVQLKNTTNLTEWGDRAYVAMLENQSVAANDQVLTVLPGGTDISIATAQKTLSLASDSDKKLYYLLGESGLWRFNPADSNFAQVTLAEGSWPKARQVEIFGGNAYMLDTANNRILKYSPKDSGFSGGTAYSQPEGQELNGAVDFAINGSVMTLMSNGKIVKYTKTGRTPVEITDLPAEVFLNAPRRIFAHSDSNDIAILHQDAWVKDLYRISFFARAGKYKRSVILPLEQGAVKSVALDLKTGLATIVTDKVVYQVNTNSS
ncbi:MAG TPA: hypothetical protein VJL27_01470, partial [Patescibacteria group bacterium]|nr:hypothetical protein [Patescibacteria group bacterium]